MISRRSLFLLFVLLSLLVSASNITFAAKPDKQHFYFVQITDTHLGDLDNDARTIKVVQSINALPMKIECVVHTGDIFQDNILDTKIVQNGNSILKQLKAPVHYVSGNHDILQGNDLEKTASVFRDILGPVSSKAQYKGVIFLMFYSEPLCDSFKLNDYDPMKWLKQSLDETKGKPVIIFTHRPTAQDFYNNSMHDTWPKEAQDQFSKLINSYNVKAVITGHYHRAEQHWLKKVPVFVASPVAGYWDRDATYRIYEYDNGKIGFRTQYPK